MKQGISTSVGPAGNADLPFTLSIFSNCYRKDRVIRLFAPVSSLNMAIWKHSSGDDSDSQPNKTEYNTEAFAAGEAIPVAHGTEEIGRAHV